MTRKGIKENEEGRKGAGKPDKRQLHVQNQTQTQTYQEKCPQMELMAREVKTS